MAILENIPTLKFLSLNLNVFMGNEMSCSRQGFPQLRTLELREIPGLEKWRVEEGAMSHLLCLKNGGRRKLEMIPDGLKFVTTIQTLQISDMPKDFVHQLEYR
ncbi:Disease resistance RPP8-like protein 3 [Forsythia ovata]|uniref:Disease resistance RPP8-like protein 3 n=1 Tax=Forsythia ovata TaxID=205694 RepID=A0ABD1PH21_9LAMI